VATLLLIHGDKDRVVPFENAHQLYRAAVGQKWMVVCHNSGHRLYPESDSLHRSSVCEFIGKVKAGVETNTVVAPESSMIEPATEVVIIRKVATSNNL